MPKLIKTPFAAEAATGYRTDIQETTGEAPNSATYQIGFPPKTMQSITADGMPPKGADMNGILYDITDNIVFQTHGGRYGFDSAYATSIGGYPLNAVLQLNNGAEVISTINNNTNDPNISLTGWKPNNLFVTPQMFGAKGDGVYDDRPAFQSAIDYLRNNGGGELLVPKPDVEYRWKSYDAANSACIVVDRPISSIYLDPISIRGIANLTRIKVELPAGTSIDSAVLFKNGGAYKRLENLSIWGGLTSTTPQVDYVVKGSDTFYPNMTVQDCQFYVAKKDCFRMATYVTLLSKLQTAYSPRGIVIAGPGIGETGNAVITSITLNSCYALNHTHYGYWFGESTYCTFNSCASDHIINTTGDGVEAYPYYIDIARGVTLSGCGAESSTRILHCRAAQGLTINGLMTLSIGDATTPPNALIRIDGGYSTVIGGLWLQNPKGYTYKLSVGNTFGRECVTVLDTSIARKEYTFTTNFGRADPVILLAYQKSLNTLNLPLTNTGDAATNATNMRAWTEFSYDTELVHTLTIQLPSGDFPINSAVFLTNGRTSGYARVVLKGNADGTSRIVCTGAGSINFGVPNMLARMSYTLDNVTIHADSGITAGTRPALFYNADVYFINSKLTSHNGAVQYAITPTSKLILDATSGIQTPALSSGIVEYSYKSTVAPTTSTRLPVGTIFMASDPNATRIGWINTVDNGATWLALNPS